MKNNVDSLNKSFFYTFKEYYWNLWSLKYVYTFVCRLHVQIFHTPFPRIVQSKLFRLRVSHNTKISLYGMRLEDQVDFVPTLWMRICYFIWNVLLKRIFSSKSFFLHIDVIYEDILPHLCTKKDFNGMVIVVVGIGSSW